MRSNFAAFVIAAVAAALLTPILRRLALRYDIVSNASRRDVHEGRIPRLGGVAICLALFLPVVGILFVDSSVSQRAFSGEVNKVIGLCAGGVAMCLLGVVDDIRGLRAAYKLVFQIGVAAIAYACGFRIDAISLPFIGEMSMGIFGLPITVLWVVGITNAVNLIDGLDGLAAGVAFFAGVTNFVVAYINGSMMAALIMAALLGAVLGFLLYNFNPARIFMGDSGSYLLGFVLAVTSLVGNSQKASTAISLLVPVVALGVPIFDTLFTMARRYLERRPLFSPDRGHVHHRLLDLGITHRRAVLILYGVSCVFTFAAIGIYLGRSWQVGAAMLVTSVVVVGLARFVGYFSIQHLRKRQRARVRSRETELLRRIVPAVPLRFADATSEEALLDELVVIAKEIDAAHIWMLRGGDTVVEWKNEDVDDRRVVAEMTYPVGNDALARASLTIAVINDFEDAEMAPQTDILLQLVVDQAARRLNELGSSLAPRQMRPSDLESQTSSGERPSVELVAKGHEVAG